MKLLLIAPCAPPKNSPESLQVGRILKCLSPVIDICLVTTPATKGWEWFDHTLSESSRDCTRIVLQLPYHHITHRVLTSRFLAGLQLPDSDFWITYLCSTVLRQLPWSPDVIYSRSSPFSAAVLARDLKTKLSAPWLMHLSDPWVDSKYLRRSRLSTAVNKRLEEQCFSSADMITVTTRKQQSFYQYKYPSLVNRLEWISNIADPDAVRDPASKADSLMPDWPIRFLYAGSFYGTRSPEPLLRAIHQVISRSPQLESRLDFTFVGNAEASHRELIRKTPCCRHIGVLSYAKCKELQQNAHVLIAIEGQGKGLLSSAILPSKVVDYISIGRPILFIGEHESLPAQYCRSGCGWFFSHDDIFSLAHHIENLAANPEPLSNFNPLQLPQELNPMHVTGKVERLLRQLIENSIHSAS